MTTLKGCLVNLKCMQQQENLMEMRLKEIVVVVTYGWPLNAT